MAAVIKKIFTVLPTSRQLRTYFKSLNTLQICTLPPYINLIIAALRFYPSVFLCKLRVYICSLCYISFLLHITYCTHFCKDEDNVPQAKKSYRRCEGYVSTYYLDWHGLMWVDNVMILQNTLCKNWTGQQFTHYIR